MKKRTKTSVGFAVDTRKADEEATTLVAYQCAEMVQGFFRGDGEKTLAWFNTPNPHLGDMLPCDMLTMGRGERLRSFIREQLAANEPADPTCPTKCDRCHWCMRKKYGPDYWATNKPKERRP